MNLVERVARLNKMVAGNRILRGAWTGARSVAAGPPDKEEQLNCAKRLDLWYNKLTG